jgi:hypothetical protein
MPFVHPATQWIVLGITFLGTIFPVQLTTAQSVTQSTAPSSPSTRPAPRPLQPIRPPQTCPTDLQTLTPLLLRDLPSYANRVTQRASGLYRNSDRPGTIIITGTPEYESLPLSPLDTRANLPDSEPSTEQPHQVFFTTLERQYVQSKPASIQHFHWLFLTSTESQWYLVTLRSQVRNETANQPATPPEDTSQGAIAQAIRLWLRDCAVGAIET